MASCDVVVIGGGCIGASIAYHLADNGCTDVLLLEAHTLASGSTSKAAGGIRLQHADELNARLAQRSLTEFTRFEALTGTDIGFRQVGYLFVLTEPDDVALFEASVRMQQALGIPVEILPPEAALEHVPQLRTDDVLAATFCPLDGYATPEAVVQGYATAARRAGVRVRQGAEVTRVVAQRGHVVGVDLGDEHIATRAVVCAAGVGSPAIAGTVGVNLPVTAERRRIFFSRQNGGVADGIPLTIDFATGFYFHREGPGLVFAGRDFEAEDLMAPALRRLPALDAVPISSYWHGDYELSPDHNGMVGESSEVAGFFYATGFSGHGFQLSPAVGEHVAELVTGRQPTLDLTPLSADRFAHAGGHRVERIFI